MVWMEARVFGAASGKEGGSSVACLASFILPDTTEHIYIETLVLLCSLSPARTPKRCSPCWCGFCLFLASRVGEVCLAPVV